MSILKSAAPMDEPPNRNCPCGSNCSVFYMIAWKSKWLKPPFFFLSLFLATIPVNWFAPLLTLIFCGSNEALSANSLDQCWLQSTACFKTNLHDVIVGFEGTEDIEYTLKQRTAESQHPTLTSTQLFKTLATLLWLFPLHSIKCVTFLSKNIFFCGIFHMEDKIND